MTKEEVRVGLMSGKTLDDLLPMVPGQDCEIFKAGMFQIHRPDEVIYIPDISLNEIKAYETITDVAQIDEIIACCYTAQDFFDLCNDWEEASSLFWACDWQHPSSAYEEDWWREEDE